MNDSHGLIVDYVLGVLGDDEARAFEERIAAEPTLAREVERMRGVLGLLPYAKATEPPPHLRAAVLRAALTQLSDREREVLELSYFKGLTQAEIADQLGAPLGTVKSWARRGLLSLRDSLQDLVG